MTKIWTFVVVSLFLQEPASMDAAIFLVRQHHFDLWLINALWLFATCFDIAVGYGIGMLLQKKLPRSRVIQWGRKWADVIENFIGKRGARVVAVLLGIVNVPYLNGFLFSWLSLSFRSSFLLLFLGNFLYWAIAWAINIGIRGVVDDPHVALYIVVGMGLCFSVVSKTIVSRLAKRT